ncbi:hypothetical protein TCAL_15462 [Tigriopus californicus]|uniref:DUF7041 domain-containing protein n=1 Tax=Tigriopus californicus TaxID=6832 RepID=A0A553PSW5_TIGCA|nr:hypothetical protein TCAL_15462 [Tigriopus californicus]
MAFSTEEMAAMADLDINPELWFAQCEAAFELSNVTSEKTKFNHCLAVLEPDVLRKVQSCIRSPDPTNPYEFFKTSLLSVLQPNRSPTSSRCDGHAPG